mgnify:CR=1 FL=1
MRLKNKVAIITGAASGMGEAMAYTFAKEGAKVVATDVQTDKLETIVANIKKEGGEIIGLKQDVSNRSQWFDEIIPQTISTFGSIDILINNAGISMAIPFQDQQEKDWEKIYGINTENGKENK